jgi:hypothetical protein
MTRKKKEKNHRYVKEKERRNLAKGKVLPEK